MVGVGGRGGFGSGDDCLIGAGRGTGPSAAPRGKR